VARQGGLRLPTRGIAFGDLFGASEMDLLYGLIQNLTLSEWLVDVVRGGLTGLYLTMLLFVSAFGLHRWHLVYLYYRHRRGRGPSEGRFAELPRVTVQLPMYNEPYVAERVIEACGRLDWPREKLQIQVLDDSTDETRGMAAAAVARWAAGGVNMEYVHRTNRGGFKAGALAHGLETATGEFIAIFDADFVPAADILHRLIHPFTDAEVGMVQARWEHINRDHSLLTQAESILLDGHFMIEHTSRNRSGRFMNFNGTAGMWRRACLESGGGWEQDTLTEDLDLSYRCQLRGWKFVYLPEVTVPAEVPPDIQGFKQQQFRWTKGAIQVAKKSLVRVLRSDLGWRVKLEAFFHLVTPMSYLFMTILIMLLLPVFGLRLSVLREQSLARALFDVSLFVVASCSASTFYLCSQREITSDWRKRMKYVPFLMSLGVGIALNNSRAVLEACFGEESAFERTPKYGLERQKRQGEWSGKASSFGRKGSLIPYLELAFGAYVTLCIALVIRQGMILSVSLPFLIIFAVGYFYVGGLTLYGNYLAQQGARPAAAEQSLLAGTAA